MVKEKYCKHCNSKFVYKSLKALYCSISCKNKSRSNSSKLKNNIRNMENYYKKYRKERIKEYYFNRNNNREKNKCIVCNKSISNKRTDSKYCTDKCYYYLRNKERTIEQKIIHSLRTRTNKFLLKSTDGKKCFSMIKILGCSKIEFKKHLESQFNNGMSWENRSQWHIDHIIPLASAKTSQDLIKLNHYTNLQLYGLKII